MKGRWGLVSYLNDLTEEYNKVSGSLMLHYKHKYKEEVERILKEAGFSLDKDVEEIDGKKRIGRLALTPSSFSSISYEVVFYPYTKKGKLSERYEVADCYFTDADEVASKYRVKADG